MGIKSNLTEIRSQHRTDRFHSDGLIVRRGFSVTFTEVPDAGGKVTLEWVPVRESRRSSELGHRVFVVTAGEEKEQQGGWTVEQDGDRVVLGVPHDAVVGVYKIQIGEETGVMTVLFNPFCEQDTVYLADEDERNEYLLNDVGQIWVGSYRSQSGRPWAFAQYATKSLLAALDLLDRMPWEDRTDPVKVVRHLSAVVNSADDKGMVTGNWSGDYSGGISPLAWTGSGEIMSMYWDEQQPVQFGQCWVFSGVLTSALRALGFPSRSVTNFVSAHDSTKPYNRAVDQYYTSSGELIEEKSQDSIWNFHVWNEVWMARPDLQEEAQQYGMSFDGWQALDSTPQEESHGIYQMGPCPLVAIKNGIVVNYDADFVIGEVNADVCHHWATDESASEFSLRQKHQRHVGRLILTKAVGSDEPHDLTLDYKYAEGTAEEREALERRPGADIQPIVEVAEDQEDVKFSLEAPDDIKTGDAITVTVTASNVGKDDRQATVHCLARAVTYTGAVMGRIKASEATHTLPSGTAETVTLELTPESYQSFLSQGLAAVQVVATGKVLDTSQTWTTSETLRFNSDELLRISCPRTAELRRQLEFQASVHNPTTFPLTNPSIRVEGQGIAKLSTFPLKGPVQPSTTVHLRMTICPVEVGDKVLIVTFDTDELKDVVRSVHIEVTDSEEGRVAGHAFSERNRGRMESLLGNMMGSIGTS